MSAISDGGSQLRLWSPSGKIYYQSNNNLFAVDIASGESSQITDFAVKDSPIKTLDISNDEKRVGYVEKIGSTWKIQSVPVSGGEPTTFAETESEVTSLVWHSDNQRILFSAYVDGTLQIFASSGSSKKPEQITNSEISNNVVDVSDDGSSILFGTAKEESNLWKVNVNSKAESAIHSSIDSELWANVSRDGGKIAFQSVKNLSQGSNLPNATILSVAADSDGQAQKLAENGFLPNWSPDGSALAFMRIGPETGEIWSAKAAGGKEQKLTEGGISTPGFSVSPYNRLQATDFSWAPDGKSIAYVSARNGFSNVWIVDAEGASDVQITTNADENLLYYCPVWSENGSSFAYATKQKRPGPDGKIMHSFFVLDIGAKESKLIHEASSWARLLGWSPGEKGLLLALPTKFGGLPPSVELAEVKFGSTERTTIVELQNTYYFNITLSYDKRSIAYVAHLEDVDDIWMISSTGGKPIKLTSNNDPNLYFSSLSWSPDSSAIYFGKQTRFSLLSMLTNFK